MFKANKLSTALGIYSAGIYIGSGMAYWLGGKVLLLAQQHQWHSALPFVKFDWQIVFILFGLPGLLIALLLYFIKEKPVEASNGKAADIKELAHYLKANNYFFLKFCMASAAFNVAVYAAGVWLPSYLQRVFKMSITESGELLGITMLFVAPVGAIAGGMVSDYWSKEDGISGRLCALVTFIIGILFCFAMLGFNHSDSFKYVPLFGLCLLMGAPVAITAATVQEIAPAHLRSTAPAFLLMLQNLIGMSLGPIIVALLTQYY